MDPIALADLCNNVCMPIRYFAEWIMNNYDLVIENAAILTMDDNGKFPKCSTENATQGIFFMASVFAVDNLQHNSKREQQ